MALYHRDVKRGDANDGTGQVIDIALYETVLNLMEATIPEFDLAGVETRTRRHAALRNRTQRDLFFVRTDAYIVIGANGDSIFRPLDDCDGPRRSGKRRTARANEWAIAAR